MLQPGERDDNSNDVEPSAKLRSHAAVVLLGLLALASYALAGWSVLQLWRMLFP